MKINLSSLSKSAFEKYNQDIIQTVSHRVRSFALENVFMYDYILSSIPKLSQFEQLRTLIFHNIESKYIENVLDQLQSLRLLSSLILDSTEDVNNRNLIYRQVFALPALKYCKLSLSSWNSKAPLEMCTNEKSPIENLVIGNSVCVDLLYRLLSYIPYVRRLSIGSLEVSDTEQEKVSVSPSNELRDLSLKLTYVKFDSLISLMRDCFRTVQVLHLTVENSSTAARYIDANKWEQLITDHLHNLRVFDIHITASISDNDDQLRIESDIDQFTSPFWIGRQCFFAHDVHWNRYSGDVFFYSTNPYRYFYILLLMIIE